MIIKADNLSIGYNSKVFLKDFNLIINRGDYIHIVGRNGSGKSTLLKTLAGVIKPVSGKVIYSKEIKKGFIGYLPQTTNLQSDFPATVEEVVLSGFVGSMGWRPFYTKAERQKALENMEKLELVGLEGAEFAKLSGGQKQRVLLARAFCAGRDVLLLDEPDASLDPFIAKKLSTLLTELSYKGVAVILVCHHGDGHKGAQRVINL